MTGDEWDGLSLFIEAWWPGEFTDLTAEAWRAALGDFDREVVLAALKACLARGDRWRPAASEILAEIRRDPAQPTFAEALALIYGRGGVLSARTTIRKAVWEAGERDRLDDEAAWDRAAELHPLICAFVRSQGLDRLRRLDLDDPEYGGARRKQLADEWAAFLEAHEAREVAALIAGRRGELGRFDPLRALGPRRIELEERASGGAPS